MPIFIATWNPARYEMTDGDYTDRVERCADAEGFDGRWSTGNRKRGIGPGDHAILMRQGDHRGIIAAGEFTGEVYQDGDWDSSSKLTNYADIHWTTWLPTEDRLPAEELKHHVPGVDWDALLASGVQMPREAAEHFDPLWSAHLARLGRTKFTSPDELSPADTYVEGAVTRIEVNRYERDSKARARALEIHGTACLVCGFNFGVVYGPAGEGFINVHHTRDLSTLGDNYEVDPTKDLIPVCPNCHAMLHRERPALSPDALRRQLKVRSGTVQ